MQTTTIAKWGNSLAVRIPKAVIDSAHLAEGDSMEVDLSAEGEIIMRSACRPLSLEELVNGITPENRPTETDWGARVGSEAW